MIGQLLHQKLRQLLDGCRVVGDIGLTDLDAFPYPGRPLETFEILKASDPVPRCAKYPISVGNPPIRHPKPVVLRLELPLDLALDPNDLPAINLL